MTKDAQIVNLKNVIRMQEDDIRRISKHNQELIAAEEGTFLHSPSYLQMQEEIKFLKNCLTIAESALADEKGRGMKQDAMINQIYEDNKNLTAEKADEEYFIGITENYHDALEYKELTEKNIKLSAQVEAQKEFIRERDAEIERLQMQAAEYKQTEEKGESVSNIEVSEKKDADTTIHNRVEIKTGNRNMFSLSRRDSSVKQKNTPILPHM